MVQKNYKSEEEEIFPLWLNSSRSTGTTPSLVFIYLFIFLFWIVSFCGESFDKDKKIRQK